MKVETAEKPPAHPNQQNSLTEDEKELLKELMQLRNGARSSLQNSQEIVLGVIDGLKLDILNLSRITVNQKYEIDRLTEILKDNKIEYNTDLVKTQPLTVTESPIKNIRDIEK